MELSKGRLGEVISSSGGSSEKGRGTSAIDSLSKGVEFFEGNLPSTGKDIRG